MQTLTRWFLCLSASNELESILDRTQKSAPYINRQAFPNTPSYVFWSSSPYVGDSSGAWDVGFDLGYVGSDGRSNAVVVRLVLGS